MNQYGTTIKRQVLKFQYVDVKNNNYNDVMLSMEKIYIDMNIDSFDGIDNILIMISPFKS